MKIDLANGPTHELHGSARFPINIGNLFPTHTNIAVPEICSLMLANSVWIMSGAEPRRTMAEGTEREDAPVAAAAATAAAITDFFFLAGAATMLQRPETVSLELRDDPLTDNMP